MAGFSLEVALEVSVPTSTVLEVASMRSIPACSGSVEDWPLSSPAELPDDSEQAQIRKKMRLATKKRYIGSFNFPKNTKKGGLAAYSFHMGLQNCAPLNYYCRNSIC
jgi:hypothetical protein